MADLALIGTLTRSSVFVSICKSVYIVFRSIAARKVHVYIDFTPFTALSVRFKTSKPFSYSIRTHTYSHFASYPCVIAHNFLA